VTVPEREPDLVPTSGSVQLVPDPRSLEALGRNHTLEAALAELVDNSIDAGARHVLIRFVRDGGRLDRLLVIDDGSGMTDERIDVAMTVGGARSYDDGEIGRFGLGLKAASFSQARSVTVVSAASGQDAVGRRWQLAKAKQDFRCEIVDRGFASLQLAHDWGFPASKTGTVVRWDDVKGFPTVVNEAAVERFLQGAFAKIRAHLGLIFHRIVDSTDLRLLIDVEDAGDVVLRTDVLALNPFGYPKTGAAGWPKRIRVGRGTRKLLLECHIWPGRSNTDEFRLDGNLIERQGLYIYYNNRLVQWGGWNGLCHADKQLNLARIALSVEGDVEQMMSLKPEKNGVEVGPHFGPSVFAAAAADGTTFADYIDRARGVLKDANRRRRVRQPVLPPGSGFAPKVRRAFSRELPLKDEDPIDIRWTRLPEEEFFEIDREERVLWLNKRYRKALAGGRDGSLNDLPVIKALLFLLTENIFAGQNMGPRDKDNIEVWQAVLTVAAREEAS
jgi:histidine kinase/DNA gyrase B/HSP90-like ATPase